MAAAYVQGGSNRSAWNGTTCAVTINGATAGNIFAVYAWWSYGVTLDSVTCPSVSGGFTLVENPTVYGTSRQGAGAYGVISTGGNLTITGTVSSGSGYLWMIVHEISGIDTTTPLEDSAGNAQTDPGTGTDAVTTGNLVTVTDGAYIGAGTMNASTADMTFTAGTGFTGRDSYTTWMVSESLIRAVAGTAPATWTQSVSYADPLSIGMAFKPAAVGRTSKNTHPWTLGMALGMERGVGGVCS